MVKKIRNVTLSEVEACLSVGSCDFDSICHLSTSSRWQRNNFSEVSI